MTQLSKCNIIIDNDSTLSNFMNDLKKVLIRNTRYKCLNLGNKNNIK